MRPFYSEKTFSGDQPVTWSITIYDTPHTIPSKGIIYRPASLGSSFGAGVDFDTATLVQMNTHFDANTVPGLKDSADVEVYGRIPVVYDYWGRQAPLGVRTSGQVALRFTGYVKTSGNYGLAFFGKGNVKVFQDGTIVQLNGANFGTLNESSPTFTSSLVSFTAGDKVDIFYWGKNLDWGGFAGRVFSNSSVISDDEVDWDLMREQDVLSASWMDSNETVSTVVLEEATQVEVTHTDGQVSACNIPVVVGGDNDIMGWQYDHVNKVLSKIGSSNTLRRGQLIKVSNGYVTEVHPGFTGHIVDIQPKGDTVVLYCESLLSRLTNQLSENLPDRLSCAVNGYTEKTGVANPVFGIPAYDHWPYEYAIKDMLLRAWVDPSLFNGKKEVRRVGETTSEDGADLFRVRGLFGGHIRIQRQARYGNPYGDSSLPEDDQYLATSELTQSLYDRASSILDRIGYFFGTDYEGNVVVRPRNNPSGMEKIDSGGTTTTHPAAVTGQYQLFTGSAWSKTITGITASRIDLVTVRGPTMGKIKVDVVRTEDSWTSSAILDLSHAEEVLYYDQVLTVDLSNITSFSVVSGRPYGTYNITITPHTAGPTTPVGLNAIRTFEIDPENPIAEFNLSTLQNAISLDGRSNTRDHVNDAIVTGARRATLTDSAKVFENVMIEYVVSRATDIHSILNPNALNYDGKKITAFLSDDSIASKDLADWSSRALVAQYRLPEPSASISHTCIPQLELYDPVYITDNQFEQFDPSKVYWVTSIKNSFKPAYAVATIELTPFVTVPSYEPREEIDLALFDGNPIINLDISYPSLSGSGTVSNPLGTGVIQPSEMILDSGTKQNDGSNYLTVSAGVMSPGTDLLRAPSLAGFSAALQQGMYEVPELRYFKNNPYHTFYNKNGTRLDLPFESGDGSSAYSIGSYYIAEDNPLEFRWHKIQDAYSGTSPFYDPYYSELTMPELINIDFDALVSGYYRVSIVDARASVPETVAWLTEPSAEDIEGDSHWSYIAAGPSKTYTWDGVDNIGTWNKLQSEEYAARQRGNFSIAEVPFIGRGFYAQNDLTTGMTHISDEVESGEVVYPIGKYSKFFVRIEVMRDTNEDLLIVNSNNGEDTLRDTSNTALGDRFIYYHLPQPNTVTIGVEDWDWVAGGNYNPSAPTANWASSPDPDATFRDNKPVRVSITAQKRKGAKFASNRSTGVKVHRVAHLSSHIWDQTAVMSEERWNDRTGSSTKKRLVNRRFTNDDHTVIYKDEYFTRGDQLSSWIFYPSLFKKDFGLGNEAVKYTNYLQMTEVPSWRPGRSIGEDRSRQLLAMMGYLFYLSVFTQDRSGRLVWAIDPTFVDKSKILTNTTPTEFPYDLNRHQRRTIYTRQWWDYPLLNTILNGGWGINQRYFGGFTDRFDYHSSETNSPLYPIENTNNYYNNSVHTTYLDPYSNQVHSAGRLVLEGISGNDNLYRDLGGLYLGIPLTQLGNWTWELDGFFWIPNISRDFHPFYVVPPMGLASYVAQLPKVPWWWEYFAYAIAGRDEAEYDNFFATIQDRTTTDYTTYRLYSGRVVEDYLKNQAIGSNFIQFQKQDDLKHYEDCRGGFTNSAGQSRDPVLVVGGDSYYCNTKLYRYFQAETDPGLQSLRVKYWNDVWRKGWWHTSFRHTYNWESSSFFPVNISRCLVSGAIDSDITKSPLRGLSYDGGAYTGWKDDHPSSMQQGSWREVGAADGLYWRNLMTNHGWLRSREFRTGDHGDAGSTDEIENPGGILAQEYKLFTGTNYPANIFMQYATKVHSTKHYNVNRVETVGMMPIAVGPRLPETRRMLMALSLTNSRRTTPV